MFENRFFFVAHFEMLRKEEENCQAWKNKVVPVYRWNPTDTGIEMETILKKSV